MCCGSRSEGSCNLDKSSCELTNSFKLSVTGILKLMLIYSDFTLKNHTFLMLGTQEFLQASSKLQTLLHSFVNATHNFTMINQEQKYLNTIKFFNIAIVF